ncbi:hypothetical protein AO064_27415 [Pseudomonas marginalis]|uniref:RHS protein conserved region domain-containing protein n=1 Tax=Pseudomonas marginalis TaxID=298 RepID=A0A9X5QLR5_PSEMA|nr:hypothetical protein AO064_27415 [Pseudomonas marginalis]
MTSEFFWQGDTLIAEHHQDRHRSYVYEPETFRPLVLLEGFGPNETKAYHYQLDHLGTPQELTAPAGEIVWSAHYRAYGEITRLDIGKIHNPLRFQGQYFDQESGLHYNRHRYYNPDIGLGEAGGRDQCVPVRAQPYGMDRSFGAQRKLPWAD